MLRGSLCLPRRGIQAVPEQLAAALPPGSIRLETPVQELTDDGVLLTDGSERSADAVVVATGAAAAAGLLPGLRAPATRTVTTLYHAAPESPLSKPILLVDSERQVLNTSVLSEVTPGYANNGRALISTSVLGAGHPGLEAAVRARLATLYQADTADWEHLATYTVEGALPAMLPPYPLDPRLPRDCGPLRLRRSPGHRLGAGRAGLRGPRRPRGSGRVGRG